MQNRDGFTLLEVVIAMVLLTVTVLGMQLSLTTMLHRATTGHIQLTASQLAEDRLERIRMEPVYDSLETYGTTETNLAGYPGYIRATRVVRTRSVTSNGDTDYKTISVRVTAPALLTPATRTLVIGKP